MSNPQPKACPPPISDFPHAVGPWSTAADLRRASVRSRSMRGRPPVAHGLFVRDNEVGDMGGGGARKNKIDRVGPQHSVAVERVQMEHEQIGSLADKVAR